MGKRLRMAIVGCGDIAASTALVSRLVPGVRMTACCDINAERARAFAARHAVESIFTDHTEMLDRAPLDMVYLAVPHHLHHDMILAAVERGLPMLVEKPLTRTLEEGVQVVRQIKEHAIKVGVNYQYRYDKGCHALARAVQNGALGKIFSVRINLPWHRERDYFNGAPWHKTIAEAGGGTLITQGSHLLDVVLWALDEKPLSAMGYAATPGFDVEIETLVHAVLETDAGTLVNITCTMAAASEGPVTIQMYGEQGSALYRDKPFPHVRFSGVKVRRRTPPEKGVHALQRSLAGFVKWVSQDKPYLTPAEDTLPVLAAVDGIYRSAKSGRRESIAGWNMAARGDQLGQQI